MGQVVRKDWFQPGNKAAVGNRGGKTKPTPITQTLIAMLHELETRAVRKRDKNGRMQIDVVTKEKIYHMCDKLYNVAMSGDVMAMVAIMNRVEGKPRQQIEMSTPEGGFVIKISKDDAQV